MKPHPKPQSAQTTLAGECRPQVVLPLFPPHLEMEAFVNFVDASIAAADPAKAARQKNIEERITVPFHFRPPPSAL
jgi:hypothetical protein